jgi:hypothetical protein
MTLTEDELASLINVKPEQFGALVIYNHPQHGNPHPLRFRLRTKSRCPLFSATWANLSPVRRNPLRPSPIRATLTEPLEQRLLDSFTTATSSWAARSRTQRPSDVFIASSSWSISKGLAMKLSAPPASAGSFI